ncbi:hypothetical protein GCM10010911_14960 [Paenibacillus nasutitermitis]|uniref:NlpC/P60 domain-containing protein n=2 Tax=Paenibacillus nasutitermitis TaxID=1652958 RepID=A0A916YS14_9BACL|nr:hypothetical protein GCM10010911_14960 [Paenibacillus nasutitermitis]
MMKNLKKKPFLKIVTTLCAAAGLTILAGYQAPTAHAATPEAKSIIKSGTEYLGVPYRFGAAAGITYAFDCSSFTQYVFKSSGVNLPRTSTAQASKGVKVAKGYLSVGDLVFFRTGGAGISHVAIYAGDGKILQSSSSKGVSIANMNSSYWKSKYVTARRVL